MSVALPWRLGPRATWTKEQREDWLDFQFKREQSGLDNMVQLLSSNYTIIFCIFIPCLTSNRVSCSTALFASSLFATLAFARFFGPLVKLRYRKGHTHILLYTRTAWIFISLIMMVSSSWSCGVGDGVRNTLVFRIINCVQLLTDFIPLQIHVFFYFPAVFFATLISDSLESETFDFGSHCMLNCLYLFFSIGLYTFKERYDFSSFRVGRQADRSNAILLATQTTLRCMLASLWDASCSCSNDGTILSSTPHLDEMFGGSSRLVGLNLNDFVAGKDERDRLQLFLRNAALAGAEQAVTLQCTMRPAAGEENNSGFEVAFYGIRLPPGASLHSVPLQDHGDILFIGIKTISSEQRAGKVPSIASENISRSFCHMAPSIASQNSVLAYGNQFQNDFETGSRVDIGEWTDAASAHTFPETVFNSLTYSASLPPNKRHTKDEAVQTQIDILALTADLAYAPAVANASTTSFRKPPKIPRKVRLNTSKRALPQFRCTPPDTVSLVMFDALMKINPQGKGCCFFHVAAASVSRFMKNLADRSCIHTFQHERTWQCGHCYAVNMVDIIDEASDDDSPPYTCCVCHSDEPIVITSDFDASSASLGVSQEG